MADRYVLLVEGPDDLHVFAHLGGHYAIPYKDLKAPHANPNGSKLLAEQGIDQLFENLPIRLKGSQLECIGVVVDADIDLASRWQALRDILIKSGYDKKNLPKAPDPAGTIIRQDRLPIVGIWIMPNNTLAGMLEDFITFLIPPDDVLWSRTRLWIDEIPQELYRFPLGHRIKAYIHAWLALQEEPGKPMGQAITKKYLDPDASHAQQLIAWIRRLFELA